MQIAGEIGAAGGTGSGEKKGSGEETGAGFVGDPEPEDAAAKSPVTIRGSAVCRSITMRMSEAGQGVVVLRFRCTADNRGWNIDSTTQ